MSWFLYDGDLRHERVKEEKSQWECYCLFKYKFSEETKGNVDIFVISETKIDDSFPIG